MNRTNGMKHIGLIVGGFAGMLAMSVANGLAQTAPTMDKYTWNPIFINKAVPPNILFIVDLSDATIPAAYGSYPISSLSGTVTAGKYAANVNLAGTGGLDLVSSSNNGVSANAATTTSPSDTFNSAKSYYGIFDPLRCYSAGSQNTPFTHGSVKGTVATDVSNVCGSSYWDGNFLNWLGMRKKDVAYQAVVGGTSKPAQSNVDGTADKLQGENVTGQNGTNNVCNNNSNPCWRYVKFVPTTTLTGRVPTGLVADAAGAAATPAGRFFGLGEGQISVNQNSSADPFDGNGGSAPTVYQLGVDLNTEPNTPSGTGSLSGNCTISPNGVPDPNFAGHLICYKRDRSLGLFQKLRLDNMHVGVMFAHADTGKAGDMQFAFDDTFNPSAITNIRNEHIQTHAPIAEALYEGLCVYRNVQGACYNNSPADFTATVNTKGDPFWFCTKDSTGNCASPLSGQNVSCCKSFVLMISPGVPEGDDNAPDSQTPFGNLFTGSQIGVTTSRLDDVAFYGQTNDLRSDLPNKQNVTFYAVNSMGGTTGASTLASAAKYGGFTDMGLLDGVPDAIGQPCAYPAGSNLGSGQSTSSAEWDVDRDCVPDTYFDASEGGDLETQVNLAIADILKKAASGTSASVLASSSTGEGALYQAFFFPGDNSGVGGAEIKWTGYTRGLFVDGFGNLREDTNGDGKLVYSQDNIIKTRFVPGPNEVVVDRYYDTTPADGKADSTIPFDSGIPLRNIVPIWEAGRKLADLTPSDTCTSATAGGSCRHLLTWIDVNADGHVQSNTEPMIEFKLANKTTLKPYLRAGTSPLDETGIINFIRGCDGYAVGSNCTEQQQLRDRRIVTGGTAAVWKYGDPIDSTPTIVGDPKERYDVIYGDNTYGDFYKRWRGRRQVAYIGANDGMLHAFNAGFYNRGDDPSSTTTQEHGWFSTTGTGAARSTPALGAELWGFIPYHLLPHLQWLARTDYDHVYYVDLKPKVTDVRIFADDGPTGTHPGGWGTILIGGMRFGGSCGNCTSSTGAPPMTYQADFNNDGTVGATEVRTFYSAYFVLDITDPEHDPVLIAIFEDPSLGLTTSYPAVLRVNPSGDAKTSNTNAKWFAIFGSGPTGYNGTTGQTSKMFAMELKSGSVGVITPFSTSDANSFMGDLITVDNNLDYRVDVSYGGNVISNGAGAPKWFGTMYRLTTASGSTTATGWGYSQAPTTLLSNYCGATCGTTTRIGPITAAATVTVDDSNHLWVYFGTGRFFDSNDKTNTDVQSFYGVKDPVLTGGCSETSITSCAQNDLLDVSSAQICITCASMVSGVSNSGTAITSFDSGATSLVGTIQGKHGWRVGLTTSGERALSAPVIIGGSVFFTSFTPSTDICAITGNGSLYGLYYLTGTAYKESTIGTSSSGGNTISSNKIDLGTGLPSQMAVHLGAQGTGSSGSAGVTGCTGGLTGIIQTSTGALNQVCGKPALSSWSRYISWNNERD
jgi:type IV pilus assembly protein PilY1